MGLLQLGPSSQPDTREIGQTLLIPCSTLSPLEKLTIRGCVSLVETTQSLWGCLLYPSLQFRHLVERSDNTNKLSKENEPINSAAAEKRSQRRGLSHSTTTENPVSRHFPSHSERLIAACSGIYTCLCSHNISPFLVSDLTIPREGFRNAFDNNILFSSNS